MSNRLTIIGSVNPVSGYGRHLIRAAQDIEALTDTQVIIRPLKTHPDAPQFTRERIVLDHLECPWELIIAPPTVCPTPGKRTVYFTMNETTRLTEANVALLNKAEHVIVPNEWNRGVFKDSGVTRPIHIVPLGIDHRIFNWRPLPPLSPIIFGTAGSGPRKGIPDVIKAFLEAFPGRNDVRLRIKVTTEDEAPDVVDPRIDVVKANYTDAEIADWYASLHYFVSASRGEGWGMMQREALCIGRRVMTCQFIGTNDIRWLIDAIDYTESAAPLPYSGDWAIPHLPFLISYMVSCGNRSSVAMVSPKRNPNPEEIPNWDRSSAELIKVLTEVGAIAEPESRSKGLIIEYPPECPKSLIPVPKYYHSGNLGDIIYGLYAIREHCGKAGAELIIGPCQHGTGANSLKTPITRLQFDMLLPLLKSQPWIKRVRWSEFYPIVEAVHDMNGFRKTWGKRHTLGIKTLCEAQFEHLGIRDRFKHDEEWLDLPVGWDKPNLARVIIHRSARWRQDDAMWRKLVNAHRDKLLFVGSADEYFEFENTFGAVSFWKVRDFLEMAQIISFGIGFVGNQSFCCSLALAFGTYVFQEQSLATPDCEFNRPGQFWTQKDDVRKVVGGWLNE